MPRCENEFLIPFELMSRIGEVADNLPHDSCTRVQKYRPRCTRTGWSQLDTRFNCLLRYLPFPATSDMERYSIIGMCLDLYMCTVSHSHLLAWTREIGHTEKYDICFLQKEDMDATRGCDKDDASVGRYPKTSRDTSGLDQTDHHSTSYLCLSQSSRSQCFSARSCVYCRARLCCTNRNKSMPRDVQVW